jgi:hypothetical protein
MENRERGRASLPALAFPFPNGKIPLRRLELLGAVNPASNPPFEVPNVGAEEPNVGAAEPNPGIPDGVYCLPVI